MADAAQVINDVVDRCGDGITNVTVVHVEESDVVRHLIKVVSGCFKMVWITTNLRRWERKQSKYESR